MEALHRSYSDLARPFGLRRHEAYLRRLLVRRRLREWMRAWGSSLAVVGNHAWRGLRFLLLYLGGAHLVQRVGPGMPSRQRHEWDGTRFSAGDPPRYF